MRHTKEFYELIDLSGDLRDVDIKNREQKLVITKKSHECSFCEKEYPAKTEMVCEKAFIDGEPTTCYTCIECVDKYAEDMGY